MCERSAIAALVHSVVARHRAIDAVDRDSHVPRGEGSRRELPAQGLVWPWLVPGCCRDELQRLAGSHPIVQQSLEEVAAYFKKAQEARSSGVGAMEVPGVRKAAVEYGRRLRQSISVAANNASPFMSMVKRVQLLYGKTWSQFIGDQLTDARPLASIEHSAEMPAVGFSDPEHMALRRFYASAMIDRLLEKSEPFAEASRE